MYDYQSRLTVAHSVNEQRLAEVRRSHLLRDVRVARTEAKTERVRRETGPGLAHRLRDLVGGVAHTHPSAHAAGAR